MTYPNLVFNTLGIITSTVTGGQGTAFLLPIGVYKVDFGSSGTSGSGAAFAIYTSVTPGALPAGMDQNTIVGSSTSTTWIQGAAIVQALAPTYLMISPVVATVAIPIAGPATGFYEARITFLRLA